MKKKDSEFWRERGKYKITETEDLKIWLSGVLSYGSKKTDIVSFARGVIDGRVDFNAIVGWYRIVIYEKENNRWFFWGDNANSQHFFYMKDTGDFSDSFLAIKQRLGNDGTPNYTAIFEMLGLGFAACEETVIKEIRKTDGYFYYIYDGERVKSVSKELKSLRYLTKAWNIKRIIKGLRGQIKGERIAAVCTGGTDSRSVISALYDLDIKTQFVITGHKDNPDMIPAHNVSRALGIPITVLDPGKKETGWIMKGFEFTDGEYDAVLSYRHYMKAQWEEIEGISYEFGGLAGEFYKNVFCQPFLWIGRKKDPAFYYNVMFKTDLRHRSWVGKEVKKAEKDVGEQLFEIAEKTKQEKTLLEKGNTVGYDILSWKSSAITNGYSSVATKIDPLMDRQLCAVASHGNCLFHSMHRWQRKQIEKDCAGLARILTDQGYSCSTDPILYTKDCIKKLIFYMGRIFNRIQKKVHPALADKKKGLWDDDYCEARKSELWRRSVEVCKMLDILNSDISEGEIPLDKTGWIITIGLTLEA